MIKTPLSRNLLLVVFLVANALMGWLYMMSMQKDFIHLRNHSEYSLAEGAVRIKDMVKKCVENRMPAVAITDSGNLFGILEFTKACKGEGIQPIIGCEVKCGEGKLVLYAKNEEGYANLLKLVSKSYIDNNDSQRLSLAEIKEYAEGLMCLTASAEGEISQMLARGDAAGAEALAANLQKIFGDRLYIELTRHGTEQELKAEKGLIKIAYDLNLPLIATNNNFFLTRDMHEAHDALLCIADGKYIFDDDRRRLNEEYYFKSSREMCALFEDIPEAITNTIEFARRCTATSPARDPILPSAQTEEGRDVNEELRAQSREGLKGRLALKEEIDPSLKDDPDWQKPYFDRLDYELGIIIGMEFPGYFLIVADFIKWSKEQDIPVGPGRGSGAGSVVAWSLLITDVDPLEFGLLFERFLNPERVSMPDFDIDFCQERREEVINYVREKYGHRQVAQIITFGKLQARAVVRDVGRVLQMSYPEVDRISKMIPFNPVAPVTLSAAIELDPEFRRLQREDERVAKLLKICLQLEGLNRHASTHAAGILIADRPLDELVPLYRDPRSEMQVSQFSMKDSETAGLVKFDFLGLRTLTLVDKAVKLIHARGEEFDLAKLPLDVDPVFEMLSKGETVGVFQLDSTLVRDAIRKMKPDCFGDIVALTSLCRPGPMENIPTYVARKHEVEAVEYPHEKLKDLLSETQGIIVYQEQVMESARILAGYSLGGADLLRRAMGKKIAAEMDKQRKMFVDGALENGIDKKKSGEIFDLIAKFAGYGFNKSHAVAYALIAYQTAYLRHFYPVEFFTACMNLDIGDTDKLNFYKHEAIKGGIEIVLPDVNISEAVFTPKNGKIIYGLAAIKGLGMEAAKQIAAERAENGKFLDVFNLAERCDNKTINKKHLSSLAKAGALDSIHKNRAQAAASAEILSRYNHALMKDNDSDQISLFGEGSAVQVQKPALVQAEKWSKNEMLSNEYDALGFYLSDHPLHKYESVLRKLKVVPSLEIEDKVIKDGQKILLSGVVATKTLRAGKKGRFGFVKLSDAFGVYEVVMYDEELINSAIDLLDSNEPLLISADAKKDEGGVRLIAESIRKISDVIKEKSDFLASADEFEYHSSGVAGVEGLCNALLAKKYEDGGLDKAKVKLVLHGEAHEVVMELPGFFALNENENEELLRLENVWVS